MRDLATIITDNNPRATTLAAVCSWCDPPASDYDENLVRLGYARHAGICDTCAANPTTRLAFTLIERLDRLDRALDTMIADCEERRGHDHRHRHHRV